MREKPHSPAQFFTIPEVAAAWGVSSSTIKRLIKDGRLPSTKIRGSRRISGRQLQAALALLEKRNPGLECQEPPGGRGFSGPIGVEPNEGYTCR